MRRIHLGSTFVFSWVVFAGCTKPALKSTIPLAPCTIHDAQGGSAVQAECGWLEVPENWDAPEGKQIALHVARVRAQLGRPAEDPVLMIPGGPGQGAAEGFSPVIPALGEVNRRRDIWLVDPRGTGMSAPLKVRKDSKGACADDAAKNDEALSEDAQVTRVAACRDSLTGDPQFYNTDAEVKDFEAVRRALGVEQWNLYGGSYGTRVALEYMRTHEDAIRTVTLDGVIAHDMILGATHQATGEAALHALAERASARFPSLEADLLALKDRLEKSPVRVTVEHPVRGEPVTETLDGKTLVAIVRFALYAPEMSALVPLAVHEAKATQRYERLMRLAKLSEAGLDDAINSFASFTVGCREDIPFVKERPPSTPFFGAGVFEVMQKVCAVWKLPAGSNRVAVASALPVLLLSGALDPVTPPQFAERAQKTLSRSKHLVAPGIGHIAVVHGCAPHLFAQHVENGGPETLDGTCLDALTPFPVFTSVVGP
jgi:pimeloyl-ACP methyl ester carboxylesterase